MAAQQGNLKQAIEHYQTVLSVTERAPFDTADQWAVLAYNNLGYHLHMLGDPSTRRYVEIGLSLACEKGILGLQTYLYSTLGEIVLAEGDVVRVEQHFTTGLELARQRNQAERIAGLLPGEAGQRVRIRANPLCQASRIGD